MNKFTFKQLSLVLLLSTAVSAPSLAAGAPDPGPNPVVPPPAATKASPSTATPKADAEKKHWWQKNDKKSSLEDPAFLKGYREAYATIYERNDYAAAIPQLLALGQTDRADVANLIGYSYRKLGKYELASNYYERALKSDPNHVRTWQYYGLWQIEQGNREQAVYHLKKIEEIAGRNTEEYRSLSAALTTGQTVY